MRNDANDQAPDRKVSRFSFATLLSALVPALAATAAVVFIATRSGSRSEKRRADGLMRVTLSQKDSQFKPIPASMGGATGDVLYSPTGPALHFKLEAKGLEPNLRYQLEVQVDSVIYTVASYAPDARGEMVIDTTIVRFEEGVCVGRNFDASRSTAGPHVIKFWVKRDGSPSSGVMPGIAPQAPGALLPCHGNGDGNYDYALLDNEVANFTGSTATRRDSAR